MIVGETMNTSVFDWDSANIDHIVEHDVTSEEAEEVVIGEPVAVGFDVINGEERWSYLGETNEGGLSLPFVASACG